jgi:hypothetical protein
MMAMAVLFLSLGVFFVFTNFQLETYPRPTRTYIGLVLLGWALFRGFTIYLRMRQEKQDEQDE